MFLSRNPNNYPQPKFLTVSHTENGIIMNLRPKEEEMELKLNLTNVYSKNIS